MQFIGFDFCQVAYVQTWFCLLWCGLCACFRRAYMHVRMTPAGDVGVAACCTTFLCFFEHMICLLFPRKAWCLAQCSIAQWLNGCVSTGICTAFCGSVGEMPLGLQHSLGQVLGTEAFVLVFLPHLWKNASMRGSCFASGLLASSGQHEGVGAGYCRRP